MNISYSNKLVWLAPERCGTQITKKIFENYDFYSLREIDGYKSNNIINSKHSHSNIIFDEYRNWKIIQNIRNPYDFVFSIFVNKYYSKPVIRFEEKLKNSFNNWIKISFLNHKNQVFPCPYYSQKNSFFVKWRFTENFTPTFLIKTENLYDDLMKLPFLERETNEKKQEIKLLVNENSFLNKRHVSFDELYEINSAKLIYEYFKTNFKIFGYNPFSFTQEFLSESEKEEFMNRELE